ncbi:hypothetical protein DFJ74DRAFT_665385 [Hyaloraphidium curvatum]|nr:hypothetical protein DFJ74DRAFT_665385 [Hyaloraphidium curvatum]
MTVGTGRTPQFDAARTDTYPEQKRKKYGDHAKAALLSAKKHAPSLLPYLITDVADAEDDLPKWFERQGATVVRHNLSFLPLLVDAVESGVKPATWISEYGTFLRLDIPLVLPSLPPPPPDVHPELVLYTDTDVLFFSDVTSCAHPRPVRGVAMGASAHGYLHPEWRGLLSSGVMLINSTALAAHRGEVIARGRKTGWPGAFDQEITSETFARLGLRDVLPLGMHWYAYWGAPPPSAGLQIVHMQGPKPSQGCMRCWMADGNGTDEALGRCGCWNGYWKQLRWVEGSAGWVRGVLVPAYDGYVAEAAKT